MYVYWQQPPFSWLLSYHFKIVINKCYVCLKNKPVGQLLWFIFVLLWKNGKTVTIHNTRWIKVHFIIFVSNVNAVLIHPAFGREVMILFVNIYLVACYFFSFSFFFFFFLPFFFILRLIWIEGEYWCLWIKHQFYWGNSANACCTTVNHGALWNFTWQTMMS